MGTNSDVHSGIIGRIDWIVCGDARADTRDLRCPERTLNSDEIVDMRHYIQHRRNYI